MQHQGDFVRYLIEKSSYSFEEVAHALHISTEELQFLLLNPTDDYSALKAIYQYIKPDLRFVQQQLKIALTRIERTFNAVQETALPDSLSLFKKFEKQIARINTALTTDSAKAQKELTVLYQKINKGIARIQSEYDVFALLGWLEKKDYFFLQISQFFYPIVLPPRVLMGLFFGFLFVFLISISFVFTEVEHEKKSDKLKVKEKEVKYACYETVCLSCGKCYEVQCFDVALSCYNNQGTLSTMDQRRRTECIKVLRADSCFLAGDFITAAELYNALTDSVTIRYSKNKKVLVKLLLTTTEEQEAAEATTQIKSLEQTLKQSSEDWSPVVKSSIKKLKKKLETTLKSQWEGTWQQEQSGKNGVIKGLVTIKFDPDFSQGSFTDEFANQVFQHGELTDLEFNQDATEIGGVWYNKSTKLKGRFFLKFNASRDQFKGYYTMPNSTKEYYWNGYK